MAKRQNYVWHLVGWKRSEPAEAQRKGRSSPLPFAKWFTTADETPEGQQFARKIEAVRALGPAGFIALGVYGEFVRVAAAQIAPLRGYLVSLDYSLPTWPEIAQRLGMADVEMLKEAFSLLAAKQLIERAKAPDFSLALARDCNAEQFPAVVRKPSGRRAANGRKAAGARRTTGGRRAAKGGVTLTRDKRRGTAPRHSASAPGNGKTGTRNKNSARKPRNSPPRKGRQGRKPRPPGDNPADCRADKPTRADPEAGQDGCNAATGVVADTGPLGSDKGSEGNVRAGPAIVYEPDQVAARIYSALYPTAGAEVEAVRNCPGRPQTREEFQARELGCFASLWAKVLTLELSPIELTMLYGRASKEAEKTQRKRGKPKRSKGAIWSYWLNSHCGSKFGVRWKRSQPQARGP